MERPEIEERTEDEPRFDQTVEVGADDVWYHGTRRGFRPGGYLFPRAFHGGQETSAPTNAGHQPLADADQWVYVTREPILAWAYAYSAAGRGKPKVLVVRPSGRLEPDPEHSINMDAWRTESARVMKVLTDAPISEIEAMSGWAVIS
jgi:hypothetical protein